MKTYKSLTVGTKAAESEMAMINEFTKSKLSPDEVYVFPVLLCDNEIDRDFERFTEKTLSELRELFVGTTGVMDHEWKTGLQKARIYKTELVSEQNRKNSLGMPYVYLKASAYTLRTSDNEGLIAEIEGGIKKEASVGVSVAKSVCSVCGAENGACAHIPGREYDGKLCYKELSGAVDAYEWSFVAVPAQKSAGVLKRFSGANMPLSKFVLTDTGAKYYAEYDALQKKAEAGERYLDSLRTEALRLCLVCDRELHGALANAASGMNETELKDLIKALENRAAEKLPLKTQLPGLKQETRFDGGEYLI